jgi:hypothetical protein
MSKELEKAVETLAENQDNLTKELNELKKTSPSLKVKTEPARPVAVPDIVIGKDKYKIKFPSFRIDGKIYLATDFAKDTDAAASLLATNPNLFIKI